MLTSGHRRAVTAEIRPAEYRYWEKIDIRLGEKQLLHFSQTPVVIA